MKDENSQCDLIFVLIVFSYEHIREYRIDAF